MGAIGCSAFTSVIRHKWAFHAHLSFVGVLDRQWTKASGLGTRSFVTTILLLMLITSSTAKHCIKSFRTQSSSTVSRAPDSTKVPSLAWIRWSSSRVPFVASSRLRTLFPLSSTPPRRFMASSTPTMPSPIPNTATSHPEDPIPAEPKAIPQLSLRPSPSQPEQTSPKSSGESTVWTNSSDDSEAPMTPMTEPEQGVDEVVDKLEDLPTAAVNFTGQSRPRRASTTLISDNPNDIRRILGEGETATKLISQCCGGGCCLLKTLAPDAGSPNYAPVVVPDNHAFRSLNLQLGPLALDSELTDTTPLPPAKMSFEPLPSKDIKYNSEVHKTPPKYVQPHPPYEVYSAPLYHARELTKPGAEEDNSFRH
ncbi:hypothetical protein P3342_000756 [Pyrenophora teres f. teres]|nr:hypothetical protein P3342_000756 [Pyrenophora teres f. teres]